MFRLIALLAIAVVAVKATKKKPKSATCVRRVVVSADAHATVNGQDLGFFLQTAVSRGQSVVTVLVGEPKADLLALLNEACQQYTSIVFLTLDTRDIGEPGRRDAFESQLTGYDAYGSVVVPGTLDGEAGTWNSGFETDPSLRLAAGYSPHDFMTYMLQLALGGETGEYREFMAWE